jgi:hypothetical protein
MNKTEVISQNLREVESLINNFKQRVALRKAERIMKKEKVLFQGTFNWYQEVIEEFTHAYSEKQAKYYMLGKVAKRVGQPVGIVAQYFNGAMDNHRIEEVT